MPKGKIPATVERYVKEHEDDGLEPSYAWALAWSRYCQFKEPNSPHCKQEGGYFPNRPELRQSSLTMRAGFLQVASLVSAVKTAAPLTGADPEMVLLAEEAVRRAPSALARLGIAGASVPRPSADMEHARRFPGSLVVYIPGDLQHEAGPVTASFTLAPLGGGSVRLTAALEVDGLGAEAEDRVLKNPSSALVLKTLIALWGGLIADLERGWNPLDDPNY